MSIQERFCAVVVHHWPAAAAMGVPPLQSERHFDQAWWDAHPEAYARDTFHFTNAPNKQGFLRAIAGTPWAASSYSQTGLLDVIAANPWPLLAAGYKANEQSLVRPDKVVVGKIEVRLIPAYLTPVQCVIDFPLTLHHTILKRYPRAKRDVLDAFLRENRNRLMEEFSADYEKYADELPRLKRAHELLEESGLVGRKTKTKA